MYLRIHLETNENAAALFLAGDDGSFYNERQRGYNSFQPWKLSSLEQHNWCFGAHVGRGARVETCLPSSSQPSLLLPATRGRLKALGMSRAEPQRHGGAPEPQRLQTTFPRNAVVSRLRPESQHPSRAGSWVFNWVFPGRRAVRSETPGVSSGRGWSCTEYLFEWVLNANPSLQEVSLVPWPPFPTHPDCGTSPGASKVGGWTCALERREEVEHRQGVGVSQLRVKRLISEKLRSLRSCSSEWLKLAKREVRFTLRVRNKVLTWTCLLSQD